MLLQLVAVQLGLDFKLAKVQKFVTWKNLKFYELVEMKCFILIKTSDLDL